MIYDITLSNGTKWKDLPTILKIDNFCVSWVSKKKVMVQMDVLSGYIKMQGID